MIDAAPPARRLAGAALVLCVVAIARVVSTYGVFSQTVDEPHHLAAGYQWLATDRYDLDAEHPPLARIGFAAPFWLRGVRLPAEGDRLALGNDLLMGQGEYRRNLALARLGNLPWFLLVVAATGAWSLRLFGRASAVLAVALVSCLPPILAHAGLATTDMAAAGTVAAALFCYSSWLRSPTWANALLLGLAIGVGLASKFSFPVFFGVAAVMFTLVHVRGRNMEGRASMRGTQIATVAVVAFCVVWGTYKFSAGRLHEIHLRMFPVKSAEATAARYANERGYEWVRADVIERYREYGRVAERRGVVNIDFVDWARAAGYPSPLAGRRGNTLAGAPPVPPPPLRARIAEPFRRSWQWIAMHLTLPAPWFFAGFEYVTWHATGAHPAFLLGSYSDRGWWYYFPVVFFFKTPLPFIALSLAGTVLLAVRSGRERDGEALGVAMAPAVMFMPAMASSINIGVRHILPIYPILAMSAAIGAMAMWRAGRLMRSGAIVLLIWYFAGTAVAHPDYLAWFNEAAGGHPERIAADSKLDWGQDLLRVAGAKRRFGIDHLSLAYFGSADPRRIGIAAEELPPLQPVRGWIAVSEMRMRFGRGANRDDYAWLNAYRPRARIGRSIRLYHVP